MERERAREVLLKLQLLYKKKLGLARYYATGEHYCEGTSRQIFLAGDGREKQIKKIRDYMELLEALEIALLSLEEG
jgi:hypothetical protein